MKLRIKNQFGELANGHIKNEFEMLVSCNFFDQGVAVVYRRGFKLFRILTGWGGKLKMSTATFSNMLQCLSTTFIITNYNLFLQMPSVLSVMEHETGKYI